MRIMKDYENENEKRMSHKDHLYNLEFLFKSCRGEGTNGFRRCILFAGPHSSVKTGGGTMFSSRGGGVPHFRVCTENAFCAQPLAGFDPVENNRPARITSRTGRFISLCVSVPVICVCAGSCSTLRPGEGGRRPRRLELSRRFWRFRCRRSESGPPVPAAGILLPE